MEMKEKKVDIHREIIRLAGPSIIEQTLIMMVGMMSTIFVGRLGKEAMAAVSMINMLIVFLQTVFSGLATGTTVIIARVIGEGDREKAKVALVQSLVLCAGISLLITAAGYIFAEPVIKVFFGGADPAVYSIALHFYRLTLIGMPFLVLDIVIASAVRGAGDTKSPMYVTAIVNIINIILSIGFIFGVHIGGFFTIAAMGVTGAAIAVTIARVSGAVMRIFVLYGIKGKLNLSLRDKYSFDMELIKRIVHVGVPAFMEQLVMQGGFLMMQVILVSMGTVQVAAFQVGANVNSLAFMPIFGLGIAATTMVGQSIGKRKYVLAEIYAYETLKISLYVIVAIGILMFVFARPIALLYTNDAEVVKLGINVIRVFGVLVPFLGVMTVNSCVLRAAGDSLYVMVTAVVGLWSCRILVSYLLFRHFGLGITGVMIGVSMDFCARAIMYIFRVKAGKWKYLKV